MSKLKCVMILLMAGFPLAAMAEDKTTVEEQAPAVQNLPSFKSFKEAYAGGNQAVKDHKWDTAVAAYGMAEKIANSNKGRSEAANAQGWAYLKAKKWTEAKESFARAAKADPGNKTALKNLGVASFRLYEYGFVGPEELKDAVKNLEAGENAELLERAKGAMAREESYTKATPEAEPKTAGMNYKALAALGDKFQAQGQFDEALKIFKQAEAAASSPASKASANNRQGLALINARQPAKSIPFFEQAVKLKPDNKVFLNNLGFGYWVLYDSGKGTKADLKKAVDAYYKANALDPSYHNENLKIALDELKEMDPEAAKAYTIKDEQEEESAATEQETPSDESGSTKDDSSNKENQDSEGK